MLPDKFNLNDCEQIQGEALHFKQSFRESQTFEKNWLGPASHSVSKVKFMFKNQVDENTWKIVNLDFGDKKRKNSNWSIITHYLKSLILVQKINYGKTLLRHI